MIDKKTVETLTEIYCVSRMSYMPPPSKLNGDIELIIMFSRNLYHPEICKWAAAGLILGQPFA